MKTPSVAIIFGGTGFIGSFFAKHLLEANYVDRVYLYDFEPLDRKASNFRKMLLLGIPNIFYIEGDVRCAINFSLHEVNVKLIANMAAVHREPGHKDYEYFETNLSGAKNVCEFAEKVFCTNIIFTSSISPYGVSESLKDESTLPIPITPYGSSKLVAEKIHQIWQAKDAINRRLVVVRPGVVFGPSEGGNVSRLIKAIIGRYFFFMGNQSTRKAGVYVKELCHAMLWVLQKQNINGETYSLFNMSMNPGPSLGEYVDAICKTQEIKRLIPIVPYRGLIVFGYLIDGFAKPLGFKHPFSPVRIRKLIRSNNILPNYLLKHGYEFQYSLYDAFSDWKKSCPEEWK